MFEHARHFPGRRRHARDRHDRVPIDLQHFVRAIVNHRVAGGRAPIARHQHAARELEGENRGRLGLRADARSTAIEAAIGPMADRTYEAVPPQERRKIGHAPRLTSRSSLAGALAIALRLVRIHLAHFLQQIARVRLGNVGRFRPAAIALVAAPTAQAPPVFPSVLA